MKYLILNRLYKDFLRGADEDDVEAEKPLGPSVISTFSKVHWRQEKHKALASKD